MTTVDMIFSLLATYFALSMFSFLYKDNPTFKLGEHTFIGLQTGITLYQGLRSIYTSGIEPVSRGDFILLIPIILGLITFTMFSGTYRWASRYPMYLMVGIGVGVTLRASIISSVVRQIQATILSLTIGSPFTMFSNIILVFGTLCALLYFIVTMEHKGPLGFIGKIGRYFIMILMGAQFATFLMLFFGMSMGPFFAMFEPPGIYLTLIVALIVIADLIRDRMRS